MIRQADLGPTRFAQLRILAASIRGGAITLGGNRTAKIYGRLNCRAGQRMKVSNRVFFRHEAEAVLHGYRPCAACLPMAYKVWKTEGDK